MNNDNDSGLGAFLVGFLIGALVGAAAALILAPQSGEMTRRQLSDASAEMRKTGQEQLEHAKEMADAYAHDYRDRAQQLGEQFQDRARIVLDAGKDAASDASGSSA